VQRRNRLTISFVSSAIGWHGIRQETRQYEIGRPCLVFITIHRRIFSRIGRWLKSRRRRDHERFSEAVETAIKEFKAKWLYYLVDSIVFMTIIATTVW